MVDADRQRNVFLGVLRVLRPELDDLKERLEVVGDAEKDKNRVTWG